MLKACGLTALGKYTLIVTEKPDAANRIAMALDIAGKAKKTVDSGVPYYHAFRNGDLVIVPALGHLYTVASKEKAKRGYPVFDYHWVPRYLAERGASNIHAWLNVIAKLSENAEEFVDACDFDLEGSIIGYSILKFACGRKEKIAKRMKAMLEKAPPSKKLLPLPEAVAAKAEAALDRLTMGGRP